MKTSRPETTDYPRMLAVSLPFGTANRQERRRQESDVRRLERRKQRYALRRARWLSVHRPELQATHQREAIQFLAQEGILATGTKRGRTHG